MAPCAPHLPEDPWPISQVGLVWLVLLWLLGHLWHLA